MINNIVLVGFMGSGKTTIGKALEKETGISFVDTDVLIETDECCKVSEIFENKGEVYFRKLENEMLTKLTVTGGLKVVSTGGGIVTNPENIPLLKQLGKVFYLRIKPETVVSRLEGDTTRPLLTEKDKFAKINKLMNDRKELYTEVADIIIDTDNLSVEEIVSQILHN